MESVVGRKKLLRLIPGPLRDLALRALLHTLFLPHSRTPYCCYLWGSCDITARFPADLFDETVYLPFEGHSLPVPARYDEYLSAVYGDYMTPPPPEKRTGGDHTVIEVDFGEKLGKETE